MNEDLSKKNYDSKGGKTSALVQILSIIASTAISFIVAIWMQSRSVPFLDWSYITEISYSIFRGAVPYVDILFPITPGTFLLQSFFMSLFGPSNIAQLIYILLNKFIVIAASCYIASRLFTGRGVQYAVTLATSLLVLTIYPYIFYDSDAEMMLIMATAFLLLAHQKEKTFLFFIAGGLFGLSVWFKHSLGVGAIIVITGLATIDTLVFKNNQLKNITLLLGAYSGLLSLFGWIYFRGGFLGVENFIDHAFVHALNVKSGKILFKLGQFTNKISFLFYLTYSLFIIWLLGRLRSKPNLKKKILVFLLGLAPTVVLLHGSFIGSLNHQKWYYSVFFSFWPTALLVGLSSVAYYFYKKRSINQAIWVFCILIGSAYAGFSSQGVAGSNYAVWPSFYLAICGVVGMLGTNRQKISEIWLIGFSVALSVFISLHLKHSHRLRYYNLSGEIQTASRPELYPLSTPGPWINKMEEMFDWVQINIPYTEKVAFLPGEDSFYFSTRRKPILPYSQIHKVVYPHQPEWLVPLIKEKADWVIFKIKMQTPHTMPMEPIIEKVKENYSLEFSNKYYLIYKKM